MSKRSDKKAQKFELKKLKEESKTKRTLARAEAGINPAKDIMSGAGSLLDKFKGKADGFVAVSDDSVLSGKSSGCLVLIIFLSSIVSYLIF